MQDDGQSQIVVLQGGSSRARGMHDGCGVVCCCRGVDLWDHVLGELDDDNVPRRKDLEMKIECRSRS
jgi:hypothetical protein